MPMKSDRVHIRLEPEYKQRIQQAALISDYSVSTFIVRSAVMAAEEVLRHGDDIVLSEKEFNDLHTSLVKPPKSSKALRRAIKACQRMMFDG